MTARRVVRERIDPRLTAALFANYRTPVDAVLELVDNAVDSRVAGRPLEVDLAVHPGRLVMEIVGGTGMSPRAIKRDYLRGATSPVASWRSRGSANRPRRPPRVATTRPSLIQEPRARPSPRRAFRARGQPAARGRPVGGGRPKSWYAASIRVSAARSSRRTVCAER